MTRYQYDDQVSALKAQGLGYSEIGRRLNLSRWTVRDICLRLDDGGGKYKVKLKRITELREQNKTYQEIADELGMTHDQVEDFCGRNDLKYSDEEKQIAQHKRALELCSWNKGKVTADWEKNVKEKYGEQFELISMSETDVNGNRTLVIRCSACGTEKTISSISTRGNIKRCCLVCRGKQVSKKVKVERKIKKLQSDLKTEKKTIKKKLKEKQVGLKLCACGMAFIPQNRKTCDECKRKNIRANESRSDTKRRIRTSDGFDKTITLQKVYEKDNGICYLCHKPCDWNDYSRSNGVFVVGRSYPTIEHVIAICHGGKHSWDNVRLACHGCNTKKGTKMLSA